MAKIRDTENSQCVAELTQKISNLEFKVSRESRQVQTAMHSVIFNNWPDAQSLIRDRFPLEIYLFHIWEMELISQNYLWNSRSVLLFISIFLFLHNNISLYLFISRTNSLLRTNRADSDLINELQNQEITTEDDLSASVTETDRMRELQDKVACLRAQVSKLEGVVMVMEVMVSYFHSVFPALTHKTSL